MLKRIQAITIIALLLSCNGEDPPPENVTPPVTIPAPSNLGYNIVNVYPHDTASFTQGLVWHNNHLYEGTGLEGKSHLMKVSLKDGKALQKLSLDKSLFGEGITILGDKIYQLTWRNKKVFVYDLGTFKKLDEFSWEYEGWGITNDGKHLIISTGSDKLYFADPATLKIVNILSVNSNYGPVPNINELEYVNGKVYANVWESDYIIVINPQSGFVEGRLDLTGILEKTGKASTGVDVLNGIAYDSTKKSFYVTGKNWPALYEIKLDQ